MIWDNCGSLTCAATSEYTYELWSFYLMHVEKAELQLLLLQVMYVVTVEPLLVLFQVMYLYRNCGIPTCAATGVWRNCEALTCAACDVCINY